MRRSTVAAAALAFALAGCAAQPLARPGPVAAASKAAPDSMRWLYGSGEGAAASIQAFRALADYVEHVTARAGEKTPPLSARMSVPMGIGGDGEESVGCAARPEAVVFDVDETLLLNLGYEYWQAATGSGYASDVWDEWERTGTAHVAPAPGAVTALKRIRARGVTVVFNTNRDAKNAAATIAALKAAGLGEPVHGETLFLKGDDRQGSAKDGRRATIAAKYCVIALAGDNLGDFSDRLNDRGQSPAQRRAVAAHDEIAALWGHGWFVLPNPVYGASIAGDIDDVFPEAARWMPREPRNESK
jgi:5'-nucleotidase (lipoprotein e(P4) family)